MAFLGCVPFLFWLAAACHLRQRCEQPWRECAAFAALIAAVWATLGTELLSLIGALTFWPVLAWWLAPLFVLARTLRREALLRFPVTTKDKPLIALAALGGLILAATFLAAALTPPTNWDALSYHLPRQVYWIQQQHVGFFPTDDWRMLTMPPLAEYIGTHLMLLSDGDRWLNLVQWFSLVLCGVTVSLITRDLGGNARMQTAAAVLTVSIPTAALQATNSKNDVIAGFLLCALAWIGLRIWARRECGPRDALLAGCAGGLLLLSKATGIILGFPLALWIGWVLLRVSRHGRAFFRASGLAVGVALLIVAGHFMRVYLEFGSLAGPSVARGGTLTNKLHTPAAFASNLARNIGMHLATPSAQANAWINDCIVAFHRWLGIGVDDERTTYRASRGFHVNLHLYNENLAKAPAHVLLGILALVGLGVQTARVKPDTVRAFLWIPFAGFALFCLVLAWQEWHARLHIPILCLSSPVIVHVLRRFSKLTEVSVGAAACLALVAVIHNEAKPLIGKNNIFQTSKRGMRFRPFETREALQLVLPRCAEMNPRVVGIFSDRWEYTLLHGLLNRLPQRPYFVKVNAVYAKDREQPEPEIVLTWLLNRSEFEREAIAAKYELTMETEKLSVYRRKANL